MIKGKEQGKNTLEAMKRLTKERIKAVNSPFFVEEEVNHKAVEITTEARVICLERKENVYARS